MLGIILYYIIGIGVTLAACYVHVIVAESRGYNVDPERVNIEGHNLPTIIGLTIWPIQLIRFMVEQDKYYQCYEKKE